MSIVIVGNGKAPPKHFANSQKCGYANDDDQNGIHGSGLRPALGRSISLERAEGGSGVFL